MIKLHVRQEKGFKGCMGNRQYYLDTMVRHSDAIVLPS